MFRANSAEPHTQVVVPRDSRGFEIRVGGSKTVLVYYSKKKGCTETIWIDNGGPDKYFEGGAQLKGGTAGIGGGLTFYRCFREIKVFWGLGVK